MSTAKQIVEKLLMKAVTLYGDLKRLYAVLPEEEEKYKITVYLDGFPEENQNLCVGGEVKGGKNMPPRYSDGSFRTRGNVLEYRFKHLGKLISVYGHSKVECWDKRTAYMINPPLPKKDSKSKKTCISLGEWLQQWYETYKVPYNHNSSLNDIQSRIQIIKEFIGCDVSLDMVSDIKLQELLNRYSDRPNSQKKLFDVINGALTRAQKSGLIVRNPCDNVIRAPYKPKRKDALEFYQQQQIFDSCSEKYLPLFFFACCTGIRIGRILDLTIEDFDFNRNEIVVFKKQRRGLSETYRIPFLTSLFDIVPKPVSGKIFPNMTRNSIKCYFDGIYKKLNIKEAMIHTFRHTFISTCYYCGIDIKKLQMWAGHSTINLTMNVYTHLLNKGSSPILKYLKKLVETR